MSEETPATTQRTIVRAEAGAGGWRDLCEGPPEPYREAPPTGEVLACIWHISDVHLCDAESTARLEYLDRFSDPDSPYRQELGDIGTYRPQEVLTVHVAVTMVETVNRFTQGPTTGASIDVALVTGDLTDNVQRNELDWYRTVIEGGTVSPRSGHESESTWVGATRVGCWDDFFWHPDGPPPGHPPDRPSGLYGYPTIPGLVDAVRRDVVSPGLRLPVISVYGNHDGLLQGTVAPDSGLRDLAVGDARITGLPNGADPMIAAESIAERGPARYIHDETSPRALVTADAMRDFTAPHDFVTATRGTDASSTYFVSRVGLLTVIALDTVNPNGGWQGSLGLTQFAWLREQLDRARQEYVVIASHHPSPTMVNDYAADGAEPRVLGPAVVELLHAYPNVIAWIAGHVHFHAALVHERADGAFVELTTSSLIDWPQQGRVLEFVRTGEGEIAIVSTVIDHHAPPAWSDDLTDVTNLASLSRVLAANDYRVRDGSLRGLTLDSSPEVRNVVWRVPDPFT